MNHSCLDLKICEGCGRLWLRSHSLADVYCRRCTILFADFPAPHSRRPKGRRCKHTRLSVEVQSTGGAR